MNIYRFTDTGDGITSIEVHGKFKSGEWSIIEPDREDPGYTIRDESGTERRLEFVARVEKPDKYNRETLDAAIAEGFAKANTA